MTLDRDFRRNRSNHPKELIIGLVVSILLHSILLIEAKNWLRAFLPDNQRKLSEPIPIEFVEVPPQQTKPPPETKRRAANNSVAGGEAKPKQPVSTARLARPVKPKAASSPKNSPAPKPGKSALPKPEQSAAILPKRSPRKQQATPPKKIAVAPTIREPQPKPQATTPAPTIREPQSKPQATTPAPTIPEPQPKPQATTATPATPQPKPQPPKIATAPTIREPKPQPQATTIAPVTPQPKPPAQARRAPTSGVASRLGGPISISGRDRNGNYQAALPNSNRFNRGAAGIDARRDVDIGSYLQQLQQQVRQQWIPGITQSSQRTVVYFVVSRSGQVSGLRIARPSGSNAIDRAALSAIQRAAPFAPLPTGYSSNYINIQFTFNINVSGELELWSR